MRWINGVPRYGNAMVIGSIFIAPPIAQYRIASSSPTWTDKTPKSGFESDDAIYFPSRKA